MGLWVSCNYDMNQHVLCSAWIDIHSRSEAVYDCTIESMIHSLRKRSYGSCNQVIDHQDIHGFVVPLTEQSVLPLCDFIWCIWSDWWCHDIMSLCIKFIMDMHCIFFPWRGKPYYHCAIRSYAQVLAQTVAQSVSPLCNSIWCIGSDKWCHHVHQVHHGRALHFLANWIPRII